MCLDYDFQFMVDVERIYHEYFAHVPIILADNVPGKVLVLGAGDGLLIRELIKYPEIKSITHVELDPKVIDLAKNHPVLSFVNEGALKDSRVEIIIADAFHYIKESKEQYDAIYMDFPSPKGYNLSKLYSREFYYFVKKRLNKNGFIVLDSPGTDDFLMRLDKNMDPVGPRKEWDVYFSTLRAAGYGTILPYVTNLDANNEKSRAIIDQFLDKKKEDWEKQVAIAGLSVSNEDWKSFMSDLLIKKILAKLQQRFVFARKEESVCKLEYNNFGIEYTVLNKARFEAAFALSKLFGSVFDRAKVNSIMLPKLPVNY